MSITNSVWDQLEDQEIIDEFELVEAFCSFEGDWTSGKFILKEGDVVTNCFRFMDL